MTPKASPEQLIADAFDEADRAIEETLRELRGAKSSFNQVVDSWISGVSAQRRKLRSERVRLARKVSSVVTK